MQMVASFAEFERAMVRERTSAGVAAARAEGRVGGRRKKLDTAKRREIAESVISGRKTGAEMARLYSISQPTVSRIVAQHRTGVAQRAVTPWSVSPNCQTSPASRSVRGYRVVLF